MYVPQQHEENDVAVLHGLLRAHPLGAWVVASPAGLLANHVPFILDAERGARGTLCAHVARANPVWRELSRELASVVMFQGPQSYITPSWYPSKHQHGQAVPTWNYVVVHAHGIPRVIDDPLWLRAHLQRLTATHEADRALPWKIDDAPADYLERMIGAVVGIEIPIERLIGKWKVSQNRPVADRLGVVAGLHGRGDPAARDMAELVQRFV